MEDIRIEQVRKIVESIITSTMYEFTEVLVTSNILILVVDKTVLYYIPLKDIPVDCGPDISFIYSNIVIYENPNYYINDVILGINLHNFLNTYLTVSNNGRVIAYNEDVRLDENFESLLSLKADDGMKFYKMPSDDIIYKTIMIPVFSGFPSINKQDNQKLGQVSFRYGFIF